jgi:hypothetical protein
MTEPTPMAIARKRLEIQMHIASVHLHMSAAVANLLKRSAYHDASKLQEPELSGFALLQLRKEEMDYGQATYSAGLEEAKDVIAWHYAANDHHPEHYPDGIDGMSLLSLLEMLCDWRAASSETRNGSIENSLRHNTEKRFKVSPQLARILWNTARELGWTEEGPAR